MAFLILNQNIIIQGEVFTHYWSQVLFTTLRGFCLRVTTLKREVLTHSSQVLFTTLREFCLRVTKMKFYKVKYSHHRSQLFPPLWEHF